MITKDSMDIVLSSKLNSINGKFPQNLYDYILDMLKESNRPELNKKPFNDDSCKEDVLWLLKIAFLWLLKTIPHNQKWLIYLRFVRLRTLKNIVWREHWRAEWVITNMEKGIDSIVEYLCDLYTINLSEKAINTLKLIGVTSLSDLYEYHDYYLNRALHEKLCALVWRRKINKKVYNEVANLIEKVYWNDISFAYKEEDDVGGLYPSNVYTHILANMDKEELSQKPFFCSHTTSDTNNIVEGIIIYNKDNVLNIKEQKVLTYRFKNCWSLDKIGAGLNISRVKVRNFIDTATKKILNKVFDVYNDMNSYVNLCKYRYISIREMLMLGICTERDYYNTVEEIKAGNLIKEWKSILRFETSFNLESSLSDEEIISEFGNKILTKIDLPRHPDAFSNSVGGCNRYELKNIFDIDTVEKLFLFDTTKLKKKKKHKEDVLDLKKLIRKYAEIELTIKRLEKRN